MGTYRESRNCEASLVDKITELLSTDGWTGIRVEKVFAQVYQGGLPCILIQQDPEDLTKLEIGSKTNIHYFYVNIRIFATSDGQRLDLKDWLSDKLEDDVDYYNYTITNGVVSGKVLAGRIAILNFLRNEKELTNTETLALEDKFRHIISFRCKIAN